MTTGARQILKRTAQEFLDDKLLHWAAALTYYALLSLFPGMLLLVSILGLVGTPLTQPLIESLSVVAPGAARDIALSSLKRLQEGGERSGLSLVVAIGAALWAGSGFVGAFIPASNTIWDVAEARPFLERLRVRITLTLILLVMIAATAIVIGVTGPVARFAGELIGAGDAAVTAWSIAKWPTLLALVTVVVAVLYRLAPNVENTHRRWLSPGSLVAVVLWVLASAGFALYASTFAAYDRTYGALAGVVILLVWLWISNIALLLGAELNAQIAHARAEAADEPPPRERVRDAPTA